MIKRNLIWDFVGRLFNQGITFVISIVLARLLFPEDFAVIAMVMVFFIIANVFIEFGLKEALVQTDEISNIQFNTVFWINLGVAVIFTSLLYFLSGAISEFYKLPKLKSIIQVLSFVFILNSLGIVHRAILIRDINFKFLSKINVFSSFVSGGIAIYLAYEGFGVWSLVVQYYISALIKQCFLWYGSRWLPKMEFDYSSAKLLVKFGKNIFFSGLLNNIFTQLDIFIIGKVFAPATLGYYSRAKNLDQLIGSYSAGSLHAVLFPVLSKIQNDKTQIREIVKKYFHLAAFVSFFFRRVVVSDSRRTYCASIFRKVVGDYTLF
ncbi:MAG: lipopolysaccharide biosynthesis protein [Flavobacteriales bacterium]|nr:lipopolysaccharide biosynthesis protein [Flavobacteriales bacterium]